MSQEAHNIDDSWKVPLYLMSGVVLGVALTALVTLTMMGVFSGDSAPAQPPAASASATPGGAP